MRIIKYKHVNLFSLVLCNVIIDIKPLEAQMIIQASNFEVTENEHQIVYLLNSFKNEDGEKPVQTVGKTAL